MSAPAFRLQTTDSDLHAIERALDAKRRAGTTTIAVPADALRHLARDHVELLDWLRSRRQVSIEAAADQRSLL